MDASPQFTALAQRYSATPMPPPGDVKPPKNDQEAAALVQQTKATIDAAGGIQNASPSVQAHIKTVVNALEEYASDNPKSVVMQKIMGAIRSDPALQPYL